MLFPGTPLDVLWRINPRGHDGLHALGVMGIVLMAAVCLACAIAARGIWVRARWGLRLAITILVVNMIGDTLGTLLLGDRRTLIGLPIDALLIAFLMSSRVRTVFRPSPEGC